MYILDFQGCTISEIKCRNTNKKPKETNNLSREEFKNSIKNQLLCSQVQIIIVKKSSPVPIRSSLWSILQPTQNPYQLTEPKTFLKNSFLVHTALKITRIWKLTAAIYFSEYQIKWNKMPNDLVRSVSAFFNRSQRERKSDRRQQRPEINIRTQKNPISNKPEIEFK